MAKWVWSRVLDIFDDEKVRGKTHQFVNVPFTFNKHSYELIDTPGHQGFVRSMIEGISSNNIHTAVIIVSMIDNEFESGFNRGMLKEHLLLARAIGIKKLIIAANKMDLIDWDVKQFKKKMRTVVAYVKTLRWKKSDVCAVPISAFYGINLIDSKGVPSWYKGPTLIDAISDSTYEIVASNIELKEVKKIIAKMIIVNVPELITAGYTCVMHVNGKEHSAEIDRIKGRPFIRSACVVEMAITTSAKLGIKTRIILRKNDSTIGFGEVIHLK
jgi:elongation factor 1-alpha